MTLTEQKLKKIQFRVENKIKKLQKEHAELLERLINQITMQCLKPCYDPCEECSCQKDIEYIESILQKDWEDILKEDG